MKRMIFFFCILTILSLVITPFPSEGSRNKIRVVATTLDMADFVKHIGGDFVDVYAISKGKIDLHFFEPVPSHIMKLRKADLLVVGGLDVDVWIQGLIDASRNPNIQFGAPGYVDPSEGIHPLQIPKGRIDGSMGDVHPYGNPHYWFTPTNVHVVVENIWKGLCRAAPEHKDVFTQNKDAYLQAVDEVFRELSVKMAAFQGTNIIQYHKSWDYLCQYFGLEITGELEPKPGIPPSVAHMRELIKQAETQEAKLLIAEPYYSKKAVKYVAERTGVKVLRLSLFLGGNSKTYLENLRYNVEAIIKNLQ